MKTVKYLLIIIWAISMFIACNGPDRNVQHGAGTNELTGVQALLWYQQAAEADAIYLQGYNIASDRIREYVAAEGSNPPAVVLDIDETVLDNSPFNVDMLRKGYAFSEEKWAVWCELRKALPLPGVLKFTKLADSLGVEVFYVSNRVSELMDATLDNMQRYGLPNADEAHVFLKTTTSSKDARRVLIRKDYEIILLLGDNLGDFDGIFDHRSDHYGKSRVMQHREQFGRKFIVFPNPIYGSWVRASFPEGMPGEQEVLDHLRGYGE